MIIFGHRGAAGEAPENTLAGFKHTIKHNVTAVELDLRLSKDKQLVVSHDHDLKRMAQLEKHVSDLTCDELALIDTRKGFYQRKSFEDNITEEQAESKYPLQKEQCGIPSLSHLLSATPEIKTYQLEIKSDEFTDRDTIIALLVKQFSTPESSGRIVITSFDDYIISNIKKKAPHIRIGYVAKDSLNKKTEQAITMNCDYLCLHYSLLLDCKNDEKAQFLKLLHQKSMHISLWTVNTTDIINKLADFPINSIITDYPSRITASPNI